MKNLTTEVYATLTGFRATVRNNGEVVESKHFKAPTGFGVNFIVGCGIAYDQVKEFFRGFGLE